MNCIILIPFEEIKNGEILIEGDKIIEITSSGAIHQYDDCIDAQGKIVAPGFIDLHIQGAGGGDLLDGTVDALQGIAKTCARFGVTGFLATTVFRPGGDNRHIEIA